MDDEEDDHDDGDEVNGCKKLMHDSVCSLSTPYLTYLYRRPAHLKPAMLSK